MGVSEDQQQGPRLVQKHDGTWDYTSHEPFMLKKGGTLPSITQVFETWGALNAQKDNAILLHHALSVGSHACATPENPTPGWWQDMIGSGRALDTDRYFIICANNLGSCFGSTGPNSLNPETGMPYNAAFPEITMLDMANAQKLVLDALGINKLHAVVGNSMGAMVSLSFAIKYADMVTRLSLTSSAYKAYPANIANRAIQQQAITMDPAWMGGNYTNNESLEGFKLARKLGLYTYRHNEEWNRRFNSHDNLEDDAEFLKYMEYNAEKFVARFDANSYLTLTTAMDLFDVSRGCDEKAKCFSRIKAKTQVISVESDVLFDPTQQNELYEMLNRGGVDVTFINHPSTYGHDAFLVETEPFTKYLQTFLSQ